MIPAKARKTISPATAKTLRGVITTSLANLDILYRRMELGVWKPQIKNVVIDIQRNKHMINECQEILRSAGYDS